MESSHIIICSWPRLPLIWIIFWPSHNLNRLFAIKILRIIKSWSRRGSTFLRIYERSQSESIFWFFHNLGRNIISSWSWLFYRFGPLIFINSIDWPSWNRVLLRRVSVHRLMSSRSWHIGHYLRIDKFSLCRNIILIQKWWTYFLALFLCYRQMCH